MDLRLPGVHPHTYFRFVPPLPWWDRTTLYALAVAVGWTAVSFLIAFLSYHRFENRFLRLKQYFAASPGGTMDERVRGNAA
jgi:peptidoglycan/LPS O-acetylase OafA/YrhL